MQALGFLAQALLALATAAGSEEDSAWIVEHLIVGKDLKDGRPG